MLSPKTANRLAILGGAFDPPHVGHVLAAHYVLLTAPVQGVLVIPCASHPFGKIQAPFEHRLAMCRLAFELLSPTVEVLDMESRREGVSYTVDTVRELMRERPATQFELVIGSDNTAELDRWKEIHVLRTLVEWRVLPRLQADGPGPHNATFCLPCVSSTEVRQLLRQNGDLSNHLPLRVHEYIQMHGLYGTAHDGATSQ